MGKIVSLITRETGLTVRAELEVLANAFLLGLAAAFVYLILLGFRKVLAHNRFFLCIEDFLFCVILALKIFSLAMQFTFGELRWYIFAGVAAGALVLALIFKKIRKLKPQI
ncbi:MAG: spore cortex biosynthesis protein YabQ [Oscillospiraceae bacterium]